MQLVSVQLTNILNISGSYIGDFLLRVRSSKKVMGPEELEIRVPVNIATTPSGSNVNFESCSLSGSGSASTGLNLDAVTNNNLIWGSIYLGSSGGSGYSTGSPSINLSNAGYSCGPLSTATITHPDVNSSTRVAVLSMYNLTSSERAGFFRVFTQTNRFIGAFGQNARGSDGRGHGSAGTLFVPLDNRRFKIQACARSGSFNVQYSVLGVVQ